MQFIFFVHVSTFLFPFPVMEKNNSDNRQRLSIKMEMKIVSCRRHLFAGDMLVHWYVQGYFFKGLASMAAAVAVKIDKNSVISNKWAAEASCQVCNGILQRSAVPTGVRVHPNPITYPDSGTFSHYGSVEKQTSFAIIVGCTACLAG